jgi:predicted RNase H-like nuclease (RuvC/YqgF family)
MENSKTTLYLGALCILLVVWGSIIDGKRHIVEKKLALETARISSAEETAEKERAESARLNSVLAQLGKKLSNVENKLDSCDSTLEDARAKLDNLTATNKELQAKLDEKTVSIIRLSKVNALLKQRIASASHSDNSHEISELERMLAEKTARIEKLEDELQSVRQELEALTGHSEAPTSSACPANCRKLSELQDACDSRTRICNRARTQLSAALKDCNKALETTRQNRELLAEKADHCATADAEIEMYKLNISVLLSKIKEQNSIITTLKAKLSEQKESAISG